MKRATFGIILTLGLLLAGYYDGYCSPFLTCDCTPVSDNIVGFQLQWGAATPVDIPGLATCASEPACVSGSLRICYDLASLPNGPFSVKALAKSSTWGNSAWTATLSDVKKSPDAPTNLRLKP
jgi:hypothetical protein